MNTGYRFGATYVGTKQVGPQEAYPIFLGDTDVSGNTSATVLHQIGMSWKLLEMYTHCLGDNYRLRIQGQVQQGKLAGAQGTFERRLEVNIKLMLFIQRAIIYARCNFG